MSFLKVTFKNDMVSLDYPMAHIRKRYLEPLLTTALKWAPVISLVGMRQTGKTTLLKGVAKTYFTLDDEDTRLQFDRSRWGALELAKPPVVIDECQKLPKLFDRVKMYVDEKRQPGRFILTGSVRFLSKKQIRESLTGRTAIIELLPLLLSEMESRPLRLDLFDALSGLDLNKREEKIRKLQSKNWLAQSHIKDHVNKGGLPGIAFRRDPKIREQMLELQMETLLGRDFYALYASKVRTEKLLNLFKEISLNQGLPLNESLLAKKVGVTSPTVKAIIDTFEGLFLVRRHGNTIYCEDGGLAHFAAEGPYLSSRQEYLSFVFRELMGRLQYSWSAAAALTQYKTRGGAEVPFVLRFRDAHQIGICVDPEPDPSEKSIRGLESFMKSPQGRAGKSTVAVILTAGNQVATLRNGILVVPIATLC